MFTPNTGETQTGQIMCYKTGHIICCQHRRTLRIDFRREGGYYISPGNAPKWWNWQTRHLEGVVGKPVRVQIPPSAPAFTPHCKASQGYRSYGWLAIGEGCPP